MKRPKAKWEIMRDERKARAEAERRRKRSLLVFPGETAAVVSASTGPSLPVLPPVSSPEVAFLPSTPELKPLPPMQPPEHPLAGADRKAFFGRILRALGESYSAVAKITGLQVREIQAIELPHRGQLVELNRDEFWTRLSDHVDERIGELIAIREEMGRKLAADRKAQIARRLRIMRR